MKKLLFIILSLTMIVTTTIVGNDIVRALETNQLQNVSNFSELTVINPVSNCYHVVGDNVTDGDGGPKFAFDNVAGSHWHTNYQSGNSDTNKYVTNFTNTTLNTIPSFKDLKDSRIYIGGSFNEVSSVSRFTYKSRINGNNVDGFEQWALFTTTSEQPTDEDFVLTATGKFTLNKGYEHVFDLKNPVNVRHFRLVAISFPTGRQVTASEIKFYSEANLNCKYYYDFDNVDGTIVKDMMGNRDGHLVGSATVAPGMNGNALSVTTPLEGMTFNELSDLGANWTISYWVKTTSDFNQKICELMDINQKCAFSLKMDTNRDSGFRVGTGSGDVLTLAFGFIKDNWYHITWTQSETSGITLYVNGNKIKTNSWTVDNAYTTPFEIIGGVGFTGLIDELKAYNYVLNNKQIQENMKYLSYKENNLAYGKTAVGLYEGGENDGQSAINGQHAASKATDGKHGVPGEHADIYTNNDVNVKSYLQVDLGAVYELSSMKLYRFYGDANKDRAYRNTVIVVSPDGNFDRENGNWSVVYNQDTTNRFGFGVGSDTTYNETADGKDIEFVSAPGRYVRVYAAGSNKNSNSHVVELQVFGSSEKVVYGREDNGMLRESDYDNSYKVTTYGNGTYTKYVDPTVLSVKAQTELVSDGAKVNARFVSTVPSKNLDDLKFKVEVLDENLNATRTAFTTTNKAYKQIASTDESAVYFNKPAETFKISASQYFFVCKLNNIPTSDTNLKIRVTPYWLPVGAEKTNENYVEGLSRTFTVGELLANAN